MMKGKNNFALFFTFLKLFLANFSQALELLILRVNMKKT